MDCVPRRGKFWASVENFLLQYRRSIDLEILQGLKNVTHYDQICCYELFLNILIFIQDLRGSYQHRFA